MEDEIIDLRFSLSGKTLPSDHCYHLYSAISARLAVAHNAEWLGIHSIKGKKCSPGIIEISNSSELRLRIPRCKATIFTELVGESLNVKGHEIIVGMPCIARLEPAPRLRARIVTIKCKAASGKSPDEVTFITSLTKQLQTLGIHFQIEALERRSIRVAKAKLTGYGIIVNHLDDRGSLILQRRGVGGKRRMGCGLFEPIS